MSSLEIGDQVRDLISNNVELQNFSENELGEVITLLERNIELKINMAIIDQLSTEDRDILFGLTAIADIDAFVKNKIVDLNKLIRDEALAVISDFKSRQAV